MRLLAGLAMAALAAFLTPSSAAEAPAGFIIHDTPKDLPDVRFQDGAGQTLGLADFRGKVLLVNLWATWCVACRHEMPTLDRLQGELGGSDFEVVALSIDRAGLEPVRKFFAEIGAKNLALYIDSANKAGRALKAYGIPVTLLLDRQGRERGRLIGPAAWDSPEMIAFLKEIIERKSSASMARRREFAAAQTRPAVASKGLEQ